MFMLEDGRAQYAKEKRWFVGSSWKIREQARDVAEFLRELGAGVYDYTDPRCRTTPEIPPENAIEWNPDTTSYGDHLAVCGYDDSIAENMRHLRVATGFVMLLPSGSDTHVELGIALALDIPSYVVGIPRNFDVTPSHLKANRWFADTGEFLSAVSSCEVPL